MRLARQKKIPIGAIEIDPPIFFPSISSLKTSLTPINYLRIMNALNVLNNQFLISAFDLDRSKEQEAFQKEFSHAKEKGMIVLMDSGGYESYWKEANSSWLQANFHRVLKAFPCQLAFGFDEQQPPNDLDAHLKILLNNYEKDQAAAGSTIILPIVHGVPEQLPVLCAKVTESSGVPMVAVPERRLGEGIFERVKTIINIRKAMDEKGRYVGLHLLGTGNPISVALYAVSGADSFDGLEWCQTVVDHESALLFHLSQADFFKDQTTWGDGEFPFRVRVLAHNLKFYADWMLRLRRGIHNGSEIDFCRLNFPRSIFGRCAAELGWRA